MARTRKRAFRDQEYWGLPVPGLGDPNARLLIVGLAPAAHGANRTGRMFTGDASGDWLAEALHRYGFATQPTSTHRDDGFELRESYLTASARCAPPDNKPTREEILACRPFLERELAVLDRVQVVILLGRIAFDTYTRLLMEQGRLQGRPAFQHGAVTELPDGRPRYLLASYHPSRQNTQTGRLTREMWHAVFAQARSLLEGASGLAAAARV
ncbi:uracil-DNA glycosylase [Limnochorda pilosa]|uniref:uracil-DNA glycosylase n=1 Tax=Limnochorda pilosa TaxID=1555112 RepID=UPI0018E0834C|nr:uracil-DNA glycosylase [Limnochorda pilosa]